MPNIKKVRNWKEYNKSLKKRGEILFSFANNFYEALYYDGEQRKGGKRIYTEKMYEYLLTLKVTLRLPWRAAMGFADKLLKQAFPGKEITVPDYAHADRECGKLNLSIRQYLPKAESGMELAFDSTGVNVYTTSGWHLRKYGKDSKWHKREQWKKIHIVMDLNNGQIMGMDYTNSNTNDCEVVKSMSKKIKGKVKNVRADGAYDTGEFREIIYNWKAKAIIPPAKTSKAQNELKNQPKEKKKYLKDRDESIEMIRRYESFDEGIKYWKKDSSYHRRSLIEATMFRLKRTFGFYLQHKNESARINEIIVKINMLNCMASLGRAEYV